ncbi:hypothetical protein EAG_05482 [Camponotus floridanus]|uniref:Uncharacterized protein n=1 Tax=Camponotus floridanus TaxID=104421 RepID=E2ARE1_CAMFO|nr:hypothetical protein EAG_05482 [Camponotus floridanus]
MDGKKDVTYGDEIKAHAKTGCAETSHRRIFFCKIVPVLRTPINLNVSGTQPEGITSESNDHSTIHLNILVNGRRRSRSEEDTNGTVVSDNAQQQQDYVSGQREPEEEEELGAEEAAAQAAAQSLQSGAEDADPEVHKRVAVQVQVQGMEGDWRAYCEHPLSVATAAMLNLQQQHQVSAVASHGDDPGASYVYEYYKLPEKTAADVKLPPTHELWSTRAYLYLAFESSGPFARFANCTTTPHEKERKSLSPSFPIRDGGLSPYILGLVGYGERGGIPYPLRRRIQETETTESSTYESCQIRGKPGGEVVQRNAAAATAARHQEHHQQQMSLIAIFEIDTTLEISFNVQSLVCGGGGYLAAILTKSGGRLWFATGL